MSKKLSAGETEGKDGLVEVHERLNAGLNSKQQAFKPFKSLLFFKLLFGLGPAFGLALSVLPLGEKAFNAILKDIPKDLVAGVVGVGVFLIVLFSLYSLSLLFVSFAELKVSGFEEPAVIFSFENQGFIGLKRLRREVNKQLNVIERENFWGLAPSFEGSVEELMFTARNI